MGRLARAVAERKSVDPLSIWADILRSGTTSKAGPVVSLNNALKVATWFACLKALSTQGIAQVPFKLMQETRDANGLKTIIAARQHPLYDLMSVAPNDFTTAFEFLETLILHAAHGDSYAFVNRGASGRIVELIQLDPARTIKKQRENYSVYFEVRGVTGEAKEFPAESVWHVKGPSWNSVMGMDVLFLAREALGLSIALEESHASLHAKGVRPSGTYSVEGTLGDAQYSALKAWIDREWAGSQSTGAPMILDRGAKWLAQAMTGVDAQHVQTRELQIQEVCRFAGVFPMVIGHADKTSTFASAEAFFDAHVKLSLAPWARRIEQSADAYLLTPKERAAGYYFKFILDGLLRGSTTARADYYAKALGSGGSQGWMTADEVRALEDFNPLGGDNAIVPRPANAAATPAPAQKSSDVHFHEGAFRTDVAAPTVTVAPAAVTVSAPSVTVNVPEREAHFDVSMPRMKSSDVHVEVHAASKRKTTIERDPITQEIISTTTEDC